MVTNMSNTKQNEGDEQMDEHTSEDLAMMEIIEDVWENCTDEQRGVLSDGEVLGQMGLSGVLDYLKSEGLVS